ncbi:MAG: hypothetical protein ABS81_02295 [Pseudonocardia sp. SCN 72-86]|nr:MAG: hypothetical protein ABS81_02295 [Pseudonocardia sp. SCN 72-86]
MLPLTSGIVGLTVVAMIMSFGNGIGSGVVMTLGADVAPPGNRLRFLSMWRLMGDTGNAAGPVVVSVVAGLTTLAWAPRHSPFATPAMMRAHRVAANGTA